MRVRELRERGAALRVSRRDRPACKRARHRFGDRPRGLDGGFGICPTRLPGGPRHRDDCFSVRERAIDHLAFLERLAVPAGLPFDERHAFAFQRARQDHRRLAFGALPLRRARRICSRSWPSMTIACQPAGARTSMSCSHIIERLWRGVHVGDAAQVVERVERRHWPPPRRILPPTRRRRGGQCGNPRAPRVRRIAQMPCPAIRWRRRQTAAAASDGLRDRSIRSFISSARRTRRLRPTRHTIGAACPSTGRSGRSDSSDLSDQASPRRRARP